MSTRWFDQTAGYFDEWSRYGGRGQRSDRAFEAPDGNRVRLVKFRCGHCDENALLTFPSAEDRPSFLCQDCWALTRLPSRPGVFQWDTCIQRHVRIGQGDGCGRCEEIEAREAERRAQALEAAEKARQAEAARQEKLREQEALRAIESMQADLARQETERATSLMRRYLDEGDHDALREWGELKPELGIEASERATSLAEIPVFVPLPLPPRLLTFQRYVEVAAPFLIMTAAYAGAVMGGLTSAHPSAMRILISLIAGTGSMVTLLLLNSRLYKWRQNRYAEKQRAWDEMARRRKELNRK